MRLTQSLLRTCTILITSSILCTHLYAETSLQPQIFPSSVSEKIDHTTVTTIFKDKTGILWIGTQYGLYRFDGNESRLFSATSSANNWIPASDIRSITENTEGETLVATFGGGVLKFDKNTNLFRGAALLASESNLFITTIYHSESRNLWVGSASNLSVTGSSNFETDTELSKTLVQIDTPTEIIGNDQGLVFIATKNSGIWVVDENLHSATKLETPTGLEFKYNSLAYSAPDKLYAGTENGQIFVFTLDGKTLVKAKSGKIADVSPPISSMVTHGHILWIGTSSGLYSVSLDTKNISKFETKNSRLSNDHITHLLSDEDSVWVGTYQGLNKIRPSNFITYDSKRGGISEDVLAFEEDHRGNLWVGTYDGLYFFDHVGLQEKKGQLVPTKDRKIMTVAEKSGQMWIGFRQAGIQILDEKNFKNIDHSATELETLPVTKILHDCSDRTWISTYGDGLYLLDDGTVKSLLNEKLFEEKFVTILMSLSDCRLLVGAETSLYLYESEEIGFRKLNFQFPNAKETPVILSLREDRAGNIWIGTKDKGIFMWPRHQNNSDQIRLIKIKNLGPLENVSVYGIEQDQFNNIWLSSQRGLIRLNKDGTFVRKFDYSDGLQGNDFNFGASLVDSNNNIYFGGVNGFTTFRAEENVKKQRTPKLLVTGIVINNSGHLISLDMPAYNQIVLDYQNHFITFKFSILDFIDPEKNIFRHKLENYDPDWIDIDNRNSATYTKLPPGDYIFRVEGANSAGVWNRDGLSVEVKVLPPPWLTWWAYTGYAFIALILGWLIYQTQYSYVLRRTKRQLESEMVENEERAYEELHEQFGLQDSLTRIAHDHGQNTLATIGRLLNAQQNYVTDHASIVSINRSAQTVATLQTLANCTYYTSEELTADLHQFTQQRLDELLERFPVDREKLVTINEVTRQRINAPSATSLAIFINEALENSLDHAFNNKEPVHYIQISLQGEPDEEQPLITVYKLAVTDNGTGIPDNIDPTMMETSGFAIMYAMAEQLSGQLDFSEHEGTRVELIFSLNIENHQGDA